MTKEEIRAIHEVHGMSGVAVERILELNSAAIRKAFEAADVYCENKDITMPMGVIREFLDKYLNVPNSNKTGTN